MRSLSRACRHFHSLDKSGNVAFADENNVARILAEGPAVYQWVPQASAQPPDSHSGISPLEGLVETCKGSDHVGYNVTTAHGRAENLMTPGWGTHTSRPEKRRL